MKPTDIELWGGPECTVNRVGEAFIDQFDRCGHAARPNDLALFADLGIKAIRYPVLWEHMAEGARGWAWMDTQLNALRHQGIRVIAGLVHHGSGPAHTHLLDDEGFATGLAGHARLAAERYPWIGDWTPVNEPLTTARFSALYGHWYPHHRDERSFWRAFLNQIDGVRLSMGAIRAVNPAAKLIQTEDLGRTFATVAVREQAAFDNLRRWATWDLLCGRVTPDHPLWRNIARHGLKDRLRAIADAPCPPDMIGINHYLTSDRFLDHRLQRYPGHVHGGNGRQLYADVEAIRVLEPPPAGLAGVVQEAWDRYGIPIAITEVHNGCTREEQLRWLADAWDSAVHLRQCGVDIRAVTAWSLLGSCGWNTLLTEPGVYEPGVFDVSGPSPRPTALAPLMRALASGTARHPLSTVAGWWRRPTRLVHPVVHRPARLQDHQAARSTGTTPDVRPLLICGATGTLGRAFARICDQRNIPFVLTDRRALDIEDERRVEAALDRHQPWALVNAAGWVRVDEAEDAVDACHAANMTAAIGLSRAAARRGIATLNFSSDLVFDGLKSTPYVESDSTTPLNVYGRSKAGMEEGVLALPGSHLIVRTAAFFSPDDAYNFAHAVAQTLSKGHPFLAASDLVITPTYVPHLVHAALDLLIDSESGLWHLSNAEPLSWAAFATRIAAQLSLSPDLVRAMPAAVLDYRAPRPGYVPLTSERATILPSLDRALQEFANYYDPRSQERKAA
ncbi:sugar nucleotide-binding protein [Sphingobium sp. AN558]|uniref:sugar nucleotide-binding protein n=1 Tax=Sphingobium sp. AN558 TaxID=3133442 RepID=UPI0030C54E2D